MRNTQNLRARHRIDVATAVSMKPGLAAPEDLAMAAVDALNDMGNLVSKQCLVHPETLTQNRIMAYALALMHLRESAGAAGFDRLTKACDALAVTVSRLIEDRSCACGQKCEALARFVVHAQAMIQMSTGGMKRHALPVPDFRTLSDRMRVERKACALM